MDTLREKFRQASGWLVCALVPLVALAYWPALAAPFSAAKWALLYWGAGVAAALFYLPAIALRLPGTSWARAAALWVGLQVLCAMTSPHNYFAIQPIFTWLAVLGIGAAVSWSSERRERQLITAVGVTAAAAAAVVLAQAAWGTDPFVAFGYRMAAVGVMRMSGTFGNPDFAASFLAVAAPALMVGLTARRAWLRVAGALGVAACAAAVVVSGFRGGVLALGVGLAVTAMAMLRGRKRCMAAMGIVVVSAAMLIPASRHKRSLDEAWAGRVFVWRASLPSTPREWLVGAGPGTFAYTYPSRAGAEVTNNPAGLPFAGNEQHAENDFIETLNEMGLLGLGLLLSFFGLWLRDTWRRARAEGAAPWAAVSLGGLTALLAAGIFDFPLHRPETLLLLAIWVALPFPGVTAPRARRSWIVQGAVAALFLLTAGVAGSMQVKTSYLVRAGQELESDGAYRTATDNYREALDWNATDADANFNLVRSLAGSRDFSAALAQSRTALKYLDDPELWIVRYRIQRQMGVDAAPELRQAAKRFPHSKALAQEVEAAR